MNLNDWIVDERGNKIHSSAIVGDNVELGYNNKIHPLAVLGMPGFIRDSELASGRIIIGDNNQIGNHTSIMVGQEKNTIIGNNNLIMNYVNIGHDVSIGNDNEIGVRSLLAGYSKIGDRNKIKINCTLRNRKIIGNDNIIGMCSSITKDFEIDGWLIYGSPARQVKIK